MWDNFPIHHFRRNKKPIIAIGHKPQKQFVTQKLQHPNYLKKALYYQELLEKGYFESQTALAKQVGISRTKTRLILRLLNLDEKIKDFILRIDDSDPGNSNTVLSQIRRAFTEDVTSDVKIVSDISLFPTEQINSHLRRDTTVNDEFIEELLDTQKDDKYAFSILALLNPQLDYRNKDFHKDHLHPISLFEPKNIETLNLSEKDKALFLASEWNDSIVNLQMLDSNENKSKQDKQLACWIEHEAKKT